ncbi:MAG: DUF429 domain-containing protein [Dehalococcoidia bacterium]|nr:DUF429 domain-containing protein [Dehalococcoidia bacterium]
MCVLDGGAAGEGLRVAALGCVVATPAGFADLLEGLGADVVVGIDAPLIVHEERWAEGALGRVYGRYGAFAYSARPAFLEKMGGMAGPEFGCELARREWELDPRRLAAGSAGRFAFETYPHAVHVAQFGLARILRYKKGRVAERCAGLAQYQVLLRDLAARVAPGLAGDALLEGVLSVDAMVLRGRARKQLEDQLDAVTCALTAYIAWRDGIAPEEVFGDAATGYIVVPRR